MRMSEEDARAYLDSIERMGAPLGEAYMVERDGRDWLRWKNKSTPFRANRDLYGRYGRSNTPPKDAKD